MVRSGCTSSEANRKPLSCVGCRSCIEGSMPRRTGRASRLQPIELAVLAQAAVHLELTASEPWSDPDLGILIGMLNVAQAEQA